MKLVVTLGLLSLLLLCHLCESFGIDKVSQPGRGRNNGGTCVGRKCNKQNKNKNRGKKNNQDIRISLYEGMIPVHDGTATNTTVASKQRDPATYWVTFVTSIRPGMVLPVSVTLAQPGAESEVSVSLRNNTNDSIIFTSAPSMMVTGGAGSHVINLKIPDDLENPRFMRGQWSGYALRVTAEGDVTFNESCIVRVSRKPFSIFVQTDKAMYKPGETVRIRALAMKPDLTVMKEPMDIVIEDPERNKMRHWRMAVSETGVVERTLPTSTSPPTGDWTIIVSIRDVIVKKKFTIQEYVLPKFEASLELPNMVYNEDLAVVGKAMGKYTFGKPVTEGTVTVIMEMEYWYNRNNRTKPFIKQSGKLNEYGEFNFRIFMSEVRKLAWEYAYNYPKGSPADQKLSYSRFKVVVNVTDSKSGMMMSTEQKISFSPSRVKLSFLGITPNVFKPGLKFQAFLKLTDLNNNAFVDYEHLEVDFNITMLVPKLTTTPIPTTAPATTPFDSKLSNMTEDIQIDTGYKKKPISSGGSRYRVPLTDRVVLANFSKPVTKSGLIVIELDAPSHATQLSLSANFSGVTVYWEASIALSKSNNFMQIQTKPTSAIKVGDIAPIAFKTTEPVDQITYQIYSKGLMLSEQTLTGTEETHFLDNVPITATMVPSCRVLAFYFRRDGEVVADSVSLQVEGSDKPNLQLAFNTTMAKPGETVRLDVIGRPNSTVFLLAVDKSVKLLKSGNDITKELVDRELMQYDMGSNFFPFWGLLRMCVMPFPTGATDANAIFREASVKMITDGNVYSRYPTNNGGGGYDANRNQRRFKAGAAVEEASVFEVTDDEPVSKVRKFFPETWLFSAVIVGPGGHTEQTLTIPDTITSWLTSAFAVHPQHGLSVLPQPAEVVTFRKIFVSLDLPYSAVRGEDICMKAHAFNYHSRPLYFTLTLGQTKGLANIRIVRDNGPSKHKELRIPIRVSHRIGKVNPNEVASTVFCVTPTEIGDLKIQINLTTSGLPGDGVERILKVVPEGLPRDHSTSCILSTKREEEMTRAVPVNFPIDSVAGSKRISVAIASDLLGPVFENLEDLLRMPYGCGEQNMINFAPNVFLIKYMQQTNTYTHELAQKAQNYMLVGYQKQLKYRHPSGAYSTFGPNKERSSGSMWLTAFVVKCFSQAMILEDDVIQIDSKLQHASVSWMISNQNSDGSFKEPGKVFNKNMQGGSGAGEALTAYVVIALAETRKLMDSVLGQDAMKLQIAIRSAQGFLEKQLDSLTDTYDLAIVTYALHLTKSDHSEKAFKLLRAKAISDSLSIHWERETEHSEPAYYWQRKFDAISIEATAYALLTYLERQDITAALPIVRWLALQRGPRGGFISTQDTVVALQGLSMVATQLYDPHFTPLDIMVEWTAKGVRMQRNVSLNSNNKLLLHKLELPVEEDNMPTDIIISASSPVATPSNFSGLAVAEVILDYNVKNPSTELRVYDLEARVMTAVKEDGFLLNLRCNRLDGKDSMVLIKVGVPTGFAVDEADMRYHVPGVSMVESMDKTFNLYYIEMGQGPITAHLPMRLEEADGFPANIKDPSVVVFDYYENGGDQQMAISYSVYEVQRSICEVQPDYEYCGFLD